MERVQASGLYLLRSFQKGERLRVVDQLPDLSGEDFGDLPPALSDGHILVVYNTKWNSSKPETVAAAIVTSCIRSGKWQPVDSEELLDLLQQYPIFHLFAREVREVLDKLITDGEAEVVELQGKYYVIPGKSLIDGVLQSPNKRQMKGSKLPQATR